MENPMTFHIDDDDQPVGRILNRREAIMLIGAGAGSLLAAAGCASMPEDPLGSDGTTSCTAKPQLTEGPYYVDTRLVRSDIRTDAATGIPKAGIPLLLTFNVSRITSGSCSPLANAVVDVWHCDALGAYSGVNDPQFGNTAGQTWLRGYQIADANGTARFTTIYPGWYQGRATHIHFNIRSAATGNSTYDFTSQLFFPEPQLTQLYSSVAPYTQKGDAGRLRNNSDRIYNQGGSQLLLTPVTNGDGYRATFIIGLVT
jgi:protocatechuate 3,4-dioxygenase beta subunit